MSEVLIITDTLTPAMDGLPKMARRAALRGMKRVVGRLLKDATHEFPTTPKLTGALRSSGSAFVDDKLIAVSKEEMISEDTGKGPTPVTQYAAQGSSDTTIVGTVIFNTPYAARVHEHPEYNFTTPGSGGKFLEWKVFGNRKRYTNFLQEELDKEIELENKRG